MHPLQDPLQHGLRKRRECSSEHSDPIAAIVLGNLDYGRYGPVVYASEGRDEAMSTMGRSLWETYLWYDSGR